MEVYKKLHTIVLRKREKNETRIKRKNPKKYKLK